METSRLCSLFGTVPTEATAVAYADGIPVVTATVWIRRGCGNPAHSDGQHIPDASGVAWASAPAWLQHALGAPRVGSGALGVDNTGGAPCACGLGSCRGAPCHRRFGRGALRCYVLRAQYPLRCFLTTLALPALWSLALTSSSTSCWPLIRGEGPNALAAVPRVLAQSTAQRRPAHRPVPSEPFSAVRSG